MELALAEQASESEFGPPAPTQNPGTGAHSCNLDASVCVCWGVGDLEEVGRPCECSGQSNQNQGTLGSARKPEV